MFEADALSNDLEFWCVDEKRCWSDPDGQVHFLEMCACKRYLDSKRLKGTKKEESECYSNAFEETEKKDE